MHPMIVKRRQSDDDTTDVFCIRGAMVTCGGGCWCVEVRTGDGLLGTILALCPCVVPFLLKSLLLRGVNQRPSPDVLFFLHRSVCWDARI